MANELCLNILGTSFTITADEDEAYLQKVFTQFQAAVENTESISGINNPLNIAVLTGFLLCDEINKKLHEVKNLRDIYHLSFDAHLNLVTIHPWLDGNGRTSRLLMNYLQSYHQVILTKIYKEDRAEYIASLIESQEKEDNAPFREFMARQFLKMLKTTTTDYMNSQKKNFRLLF
jgi:cell division protein ZapA (FtsZ GTPase activity inhibitor)